MLAAYNMPLLPYTEPGPTCFHSSLLQNSFVESFPKSDVKADYTIVPITIRHHQTGIDDPYGSYCWKRKNNWNLKQDKSVMVTQVDVPCLYHESGFATEPQNIEIPKVDSPYWWPQKKGEALSCNRAYNEESSDGLDELKEVMQDIAARASYQLMEKVKKAEYNDENRSKLFDWVPEHKQESFNLANQEIQDDIIKPVVEEELSKLYEQINSKNSVLFEFFDKNSAKYFSLFLYIRGGIVEYIILEPNKDPDEQYISNKLKRNNHKLKVVLSTEAFMCLYIGAWFSLEYMEKYGLITFDSSELKVLFLDILPFFRGSEYGMDGFSVYQLKELGHGVDLPCRKHIIEPLLEKMVRIL